MTKYIATRLHKAIEMAPDEPFFERCSNLPHYVVDPTLIELLSRSDVESSIRAMLEADILHLPFPEMLIEADFGKDSRALVILEEYQDRFRGQIAVMRTEAVEIDPAMIAVTLGSDGMTAVSDSERTHPTWSQVVGLAIGVALLMLNIQGIDREVIDVARLNKHRAANGKPAIPRHTVMRIGHVYDSDGKRHSLTGSGRMMPVHMRAGHARRQHYGEGNELTKIVFIPPVLVNFRPGVEVRQPKRIVAA